jgi:hypothetical protein
MANERKCGQQAYKPRDPSAPRYGTPDGLTSSRPVSRLMTAA